MIKLTEKDTREYHERFYVYAYLDPRKPGKYQYDGLDVCFLYEPFYVGKGQGRRHKDHLMHATSNYPYSRNNLKINKIKKIINETSTEPIILKLHENISNTESNKLEMNAIRVIGRIDIKTGPLTNLTNGGEGTIGIVYSEDYKRKMSVAVKNRNWTYTKEYGEKISKAKKGVKMSEEARRNMSKSAKGKIISEETKRKMSIASKGHKHSEETKRKISLGHQGKVMSEESKKKMSISGKGKVISKETRKKISDAQKGISKGKGKDNPRAKIWTLLNDDGRKIIVKDLVGFCSENNLCYSCIKITLKYPHRSSYKGWRVISSEEKK
jgi:hypothetical protein